MPGRRGFLPGRWGFLLLALSVPTIAHAQTAPGRTPLAPPAPVSQSAGQGGQSAPGAAYVLSPDDQLNISVLGHENLTQSVVILPDGTFQYPIVGAVHAAGLTVAGLKRTLVQGLSTDLNQPQVTVTVVQTRPRMVSVLGDVHAPGLYPVHPGTHLEDILAACGGPAQPAQLTQATLVTDGGTKSTPIDVLGLMNDTDPTENVPMEAGDVLLVQAKNPETGQVQVIGEVLRPGAYSVPVDGLTVEAVLAETGGAAPDGALTQAQIMHDGKSIPVNLHPLMTDLNAPVGQTVLMPGDVLLIPQDLNKVAILGEVHQAQDYLIPDGKTLTVADAVALAGGPTSQAARGKATIVRRGADGQPVVIPVDLDALLAGKTQVADVPLQPNDILYVPTRHQAPGFNPLNLLGYASGFNYLFPHH